MVNPIYHAKWFRAEWFTINSTMMNWLALAAFLLTFLYMELFTSLESSLGDSFLFVIVGLITTSYGILPVFLDWRERYPDHTWALVVSDILVTILITAGAYYFCFSGYNLVKLMM